jgi:21S rRNA (uridine2791-2'-O)-methyltransferase
MLNIKFLREARPSLILYVPEERMLDSRQKADYTQGYAPGSWSQVAVERTKPNGRIIGIDVIPAQPPKGVSTIQGNFLSTEVQNEVKRFLLDADLGRPKRSPFLTADTTDELVDEDQSYIDLERHTDIETAELDVPNTRKKKKQEAPGRVVDVVLSDMSAPWEQTSGFWKRSLSDPYFRMMNTSGINFKDHAGSMVRRNYLYFFIQN